LPGDAVLVAAPHKTERSAGAIAVFEESRMDHKGGALSSSPPQTSRPAAAVTKRRICVARIGAAHGTRGEVKLWSFTAEPGAVGAYGPLETADGAMSFDIEALRPAKDFFVARLVGVTDRNAAERLRNTDLFVPRERLPAPLDDEFYHADLIGLAAETTNGAAFGTVLGVHNFGAGDILEISPATGGETLLLPFTPSAVPKIDIAAGHIIVDPPVGFLEPGEPDSEPPVPSPTGE
jgi:16S rRNA processing protein RimM